MSMNEDLQETPWWLHPQQSIMETTTQNSNSNSSSSSSYKIQPQQQFSSWPNSPHQFYHHKPWLNSSNNNDNSSNSHNTPPSFNEEGEPGDQQMTTTINANTTSQVHEPDFAKEAMFEKPLTPSDVGKLNRLVIPKQYAEKYFPLGGGGGGGESGSDKGLLLSFEDESGKCWRFRYSYWNSSQSYVLTKGWSRYVKEKRLDAGDVILFERHRSDSERLFIGWRRRGSAADAQSGGGWPRGFPSPTHPYPVVTVPLYHHHHHHHADAVSQGQTTSVGSSKTLRLFGVNLECQLGESEETSSTSELLGQGQGHRQLNNNSMEDHNSTEL